MPERLATIASGRTDTEPTPEEYRERIVPLYQSNLIDAELVEFKRNLNGEAGPTQNQQRELITALRLGDPTASIDLVSHNKGVVAAVAFAFKDYAPDDPQALLDVGNYALLRAARSHNFRESKSSFTAAAIPIIHRALSSRFAAEVEPAFDVYGGQPVIELYKFLAVTQDESSRAEKTQRLRRRKKAQLDTAFIRNNAKILRRINNPNLDNEQRFGIGHNDTYAVLEDAQRVLGVTNRASVALACLKAGVEFELPPIPDASTLTQRHRLIASLMHLPYVEIGRQLGIDVPLVNHASTRIRAKIGARSRTEAVVMARLGNYVPDRIHPALAPFSPFQREILPFIYLDNDDIVAATGHKHAASAIYSASQKVGAPNRRALALHLQQNGFDFPISEPRRPLHELFDTRQMELIKNLHLSDQEISQQLGMTESAVGSYAYWFSKKAGARNRIELLLMGHKFETEEKREPDTRTKREKLAERLGWQTLDALRLEELMRDLKPRTQAIITDYYLSDDEKISWNAIAKKYEMHRVNAMQTVSKAVLRMRELDSTHPIANQGLTDL